MPEVNISIGGRLFEVACQDGEQRYLEAAAQHHFDPEIGEVEGEQYAAKAGQLGGAVQFPVRVKQQDGEGGEALIQRDQGQQPACNEKQGCLHARLSRRTAPA